MEQANNHPEPAKKANRGSFKPGDHRINRRGRAVRRVPTLAERVEAWGGNGPCPVCGRESPPKSGRLMQQVLSEKELRARLTSVGHDSPYVVHLPDDAQIVAIELNPVRGVVVTFRSERFKPVVGGEPIRELGRSHFGERPKWW
jgi:hypothetical protein